MLVQQNALVYVQDFGQSPNGTSVGDGSVDTPTSSLLREDGPLLLFDLLSVTERNVLLRVILASHRALALTSTEIDQLKSLRLFSARNLSAPAGAGLASTGGGSPSFTAVAIKDCLSGAFWCASESVLEGVLMTHVQGHQQPPPAPPAPPAQVTVTGNGVREEGSLSSAMRSVVGTLGQGLGLGGTLPSASDPTLTQTQAPVVLLHDAALVDLYTLLGVAELTAAAAVRRFTLPSLVNPHLPGPERLSAMLALAPKWRVYREDTDLVATLKEVAWVPAWDSTKTGASHSADGRTGTGTRASSSTSSSPHLDAILDPIHHCHQGCGVPEYRRPDQLLSWINTDLFDSLRGPQQSKYFAPPVPFHTSRPPPAHSGNTTIPTGNISGMSLVATTSSGGDSGGNSGSSSSLDTSNEALYSMLTDLGMAPDLTGEYLVRIASDIQSSASTTGSGTGGTASASATDGSAVISGASGTDNSVSGTMNTSSEPLSSLQQARDRGRRLLRYLTKLGGMGTGSSTTTTDLFTNDLCRRLRRITFVPTERPTAVELGGHVVYEPSLGCFDQLLALHAGTGTGAGASGALGFTVMPLLEGDLAPPQIFFSSLGVTSQPPLEVVLRHIRNLTSCGDSLDRWNTQHFTLRETFSALFVYLAEHWREVVPNVKDALRAAQLVPVGHTLVRPSRLFFRLAGEDFAPFMHEMPR